MSTPVLTPRRRRALPDSEVIQELIDLQANRRPPLKMVNRLTNACRTRVASVHGYGPDTPEHLRKKLFKEADAIIKAICSGKSHASPDLVKYVNAARVGIDAFASILANFSKLMKREAAKLPAAQWLKLPEQKGFGLLNLAIIVAEAGDLNGYAAPGKLWKRFGCAPIERKGQSRMPSSWRSRKVLTAEEWTEIGYCPRRRSVAYGLGACLIKANGDGPYRARYDDARRRVLETHPEWKWNPHKACGGDGCDGCYGSGKTCTQSVSHGLLLMTKLALKNLWIEWTDGGNDCTLAS